MVENKNSSSSASSKKCSFTPEIGSVVTSSISRFARLPCDVLYHPDRTPVDCVVFAHLALIARNGPLVSIRANQMAKFLGIHRVTVGKSLDRLVELGFLQRVDLRPGETDRYLILHPIFKSTKPLPNRWGKKMPANGEVNRPQMVPEWYSADTLRLIDDISALSGEKQFMHIVAKGIERLHADVVQAESDGMLGWRSKIFPHSRRVGSWRKDVDGE